MKVFLSYSHLDKDLAGQIKRGLEDYGLEVFLAHDDIKPSAKWEDRILAELKACNVFLPILTKDFDESDWTDQEVGIALTLNKLIIPLKITVNPHGFIKRILALLIKTSNIASSCHKLAGVINSDSERGDLFRDALIKKFGGSDSYNNGAHNTELLISLKGYTPRQVEKIVRYTIVNNQINKFFKSRRMLRYFIDEYKKNTDSKLYQLFYKKIT